MLIQYFSVHLRLRDWTTIRKLHSVHQEEEQSRLFYFREFQEYCHTQGSLRHYEIPVTIGSNVDEE